MKHPTNTKERISAITRIVQKLNANQQEALYKELAKFELLEKAAKIDADAPKHSLTIKEIVDECNLVRTQNHAGRKASH